MNRLLFPIAFALWSCQSITFYPGPQIRYLRPAEAPLFAAAQVLIIAPYDSQGQELARRLASRIAAERTNAVVLAEAGVGAHAQRPGSIVVRLQVVTSSGINVSVHNGVSTSSSWGKAEVYVTAYDGPSGRVVQQLRYSELDGNIPRAMMKVEELLFREVAPTQDSLISEIPQLQDHGFGEAAGHMTAGRWSVAAELLESHAGDTFESPEEEAAFHYAIGSCYRFEGLRGEADAPEKFGHAVEFLERAVALEPDSLRYINALSATRGNVVEYEALQAQLEMWRRNR